MRNFHIENTISTLSHPFKPVKSRESSKGIYEMTKKKGKWQHATFGMVYVTWNGGLIGVKFVKYESQI